MRSNQRPDEYHHARLLLELTCSRIKISAVQDKVNLNKLARAVGELFQEAYHSNHGGQFATRSTLTCLLNYINKEHRSFQFVSGHSDKYRSMRNATSEEKEEAAIRDLADQMNSDGIHHHYMRAMLAMLTRYKQLGGDITFIEHPFEKQCELYLSLVDFTKQNEKYAAIFAFAPAEPRQSMARPVAKVEPEQQPPAPVVDRVAEEVLAFVDRCNKKKESNSTLFSKLPDAMQNKYESRHKIYFDAQTLDIINVPVTARSMMFFEYTTLTAQNVDAQGLRAEPGTNEKFKLADIRVARTAHQQIEEDLLRLTNKAAKQKPAPEAQEEAPVAEIRRSPGM